MSILNNVKKGLGPIETPSLGSTQQDLFRQAAAAKGEQADTSATGGRVSNLQEQRAAAAAKLQGQQLQTQVDFQAGALQQQERQQEQAIQTASREVSVKETQVKEYFLNKAEEIIQQFEQGKDKLKYAKQEAMAEQAKFLLRLNTEKYTTQLEIMGNRLRLQDQIRFEEELTKSIWDYDRETLEQSLALQSIINAEDRQFQAELAHLKLEQALELGKLESDSANTLAKYQAISTMTTAAVKGGTEIYKERQESKKPKKQEDTTWD